MKCKTCQGVYESRQADGRPYEHACPPLSEPEFAALPVGQKPGKGVGAERDNKRDERITLDAEGKRSGIVSEGGGVQ